MGSAEAGADLAGGAEQMKILSPKSVFQIKHARENRSFQPKGLKLGLYSRPVCSLNVSIRFGTRISDFRQFTSPL
jgi:hypothetical protein